ncbi:Lar family restriction alleviation protein [Rhodocyclus gracilis]
MLPCPFCGGTNPGVVYVPGAPVRQVVCGDCGASGGSVSGQFATRRQAVEMWNARAEVERA